MVDKVFELCKLVLHSSCAPNSRVNLRDISRVYGYTTNSVIRLYKKIDLGKQQFLSFG